MAGERLLVVDDEELIRKMFSDYFAGLGYSVVTAKSGRDALAKFVPEHFDCVISDLMMPEMDGMEFLRELRQRDKKTAFFLMTGFPSIETAIEAIRVGAYDYITKPLNLEDVRIKVERAVYLKGVEKSLKKASGLLWAILISVPLWLILGIAVGIAWRHL